MRAGVTTGEHWIFFAYKRSASARSGESCYARSGLFSVRAAEDILYVDWILGVLLDWVRMVALTPFLFAPSPTPSPFPHSPDSQHSQHSPARTRVSRPAWLSATAMLTVKGHLQIENTGNCDTFEYFEDPQYE